MSNIVFLILTIISGFVCEYFIEFPTQDGGYTTGPLAMMLLPGLTFGSVLGIYFWLKEKLSLKEISIMIAMTLAAWIVAFSLSLFSVSALLVVSSIFGALIIATAIRRVHSYYALWPLVLAGGLGGLVFQILYHQPYYGAFIAWQLIVTITVIITTTSKKFIVSSEPETTPRTNTNTILSTVVLSVILILLVLLLVFSWFYEKGNG